MSGLLQTSENEGVPTVMLTQAPTGLDSPIASPDLAWAVAEINKYRAIYTEYQRYYGGEHRLTFSTDGYREQFARMVKHLNANISPAIVTAFTDKLALTGFEEHEGSTAADNSGEVAAEKGEADEAFALWEDEGLDILADEVHDESLINGDGYVIVWPDEDGRAAFYANDATEMAVRYNVERKDRIEVAAKMWADGKYWRVTLYYADRLEKYRTTTPSQGGTAPATGRPFARFRPEGDTEWPVPNEYGAVPVFHFPAGGKIGGRGISELKDVLPIQDALNKAIADRVVAAEFSAYVQRWATGIERRQVWNAETQTMEDDPIEAELGIRRILTASDAQAKFGQFTPTDLDQFTGLVDSYFSTVGKLKGIPPHYFYQVTGDFPSGESQRTAEGRIVKRVERLQRRFGAVWARIVAFGLLINGVGDGTPAYKAKWRSAEPRGKQEMVTNFKTATDAGMPMETAAQEFLDMPQEKIDTMLDAKEEADKAAVESAQAAFTRSMDAGRVNTPPPKATGAAKPTIPAK